MSRTLTGWSFWGTRGSRGTEAPARQPGTHVNPLQRAGPIRVRAEIPRATRKRPFLNHAPIPLFLDSDRRTFPPCPAVGSHREPRWTLRERSRPEATNGLLFPLLGRNGTEPVSELEQRRFLYSRSLLLCPIHASRAAQGFAMARIVAGRCADCKGVEIPRCVQLAGYCLNLLIATRHTP